jgi:hypothetical protein
MIEKVVLSTWKKYYNYQKIEGVRVMSTTLPPLERPLAALRDLFLKISLDLLRCLAAFF